MSIENNMTSAPTATDTAREKLLGLIEGRLERVKATPVDRIDWFQEAMDLLEEVEAWTVDYHPGGYLIFVDPADSITMESI